MMNFYNWQGFLVIGMVGVVDGYRFFFNDCIMTYLINEIIFIDPKHLGHNNGLT